MKISTKAQIVSQNQFNNRRGFMGARMYTKYRNSWFYSLRKLLTPQHAEEKQKTLIILSYRKRLLDRGNLYGGSKPVPDCLKDLGYIYDDRESYLDEYCFQIKISGKDEPQTEIILLEGFPLREKLNNIVSDYLKLESHLVLL